MRSILRSLVIFMLISPVAALATPMGITVTGTVNSSYDATGNFFGAGLGLSNDGYNSILGHQVSLRYTYDTANAPPDAYAGMSMTASLFRSGGFGIPSWISFTAALDGTPLPDIVRGSGNYQNLGDIGFSTEPLLPGSTYQAVSVFSSAEDTGPNGYYGEEDSHFYFYDRLSAMLNGYGLDQTFSLQNDGTNRLGQGDAQWFHWSNDGPLPVNEHATLGFDVTSITVRSVPEPAPIPLIGLAFGALAVVRRNRTPR
jgi:hypothetical protein